MLDGSNVLVGQSSTGAMPAAADVPTIVQALNASGLQFQQIFVQLDGKWVPVK